MTKILYHNFWIFFLKLKHDYGQIKILGLEFKLWEVTLMGSNDLKIARIGSYFPSV